MRAGRQGRHVVDHQRGRRARRRRARPARRRARRGPRRPGTKSCWCARARSRPGCPRSGSSAARATSRRSRPSPRSASPASWSGSRRRSPSGASSPARCCSPRTTSGSAPSTSTPATPSAASSTSGWSRSSTRTTPSPTTRSATATTTGSPRSSRTWSTPTCCVLLTDTDGLFTADPRLDDGASLIEEILEVDAALEAVAGGAGSAGAAAGWRASSPRPRSPPGRGCGRSSPPPTRPAVVLDAIDGHARSAPSSAPRADAPLEPQALDRVRASARPAGSWSTPAARQRPRRGPPVAAARRRAGGRGPLRAPTTRSRSSTDDGVAFAKGLVRYDSETLGPGRRPAHQRPARRLTPRGHPPRRPRGVDLSVGGPARKKLPGCPCAPA